MSDSQDFYINSVRLMGAIHHLEFLGRKVEEQSVPGLYRIDDGPEITIKQLIHISMYAKNGGN